MVSFGHLSPLVGQKGSPVIDCEKFKELKPK